MLTFLTVLFGADVARELPAFSAGRYGPEWADRLYRGIRRNLAGDFRLLCLVDDDYAFEEPVEAVRLRDPSEAWMCINEAFRPDLGVERGILMGLDTVITGSLDELAVIDAPLVLPRDPFQVRVPCNAVVLFDAATADIIWRTWDGDRELWRRECRIFDRPSEMVFLRTLAPRLDYQYLDDLLPGQVLSYKAHVRNNPDALAQARIVYFHGWPKPCDLPAGDPCRHAWEAAG